MTPAVTSIGLPKETRQVTRGVVLVTPRLVLRLMDHADVARISALSDLMRQKDVDAPALDYAALDELCTLFQAEWRQHGIGHLVIVRRDDDRTIGHIHLKRLLDCKTGRAAELSYAIDGPYQSQGYATEAVDAVLRFAFDEAGFDYVVACVEPDNLASVRVAEKNGMAPVAEGRVRSQQMRRYLLPALMWRFHQKLRRPAPAPDAVATVASAGA